MQVQLYHRWQCPCSARVREFIDEHRIENIKFLNTEEPELAEALQNLTGYAQVPCLVVGGRPLLESAEIINWIQRHLATADSSMSRPWSDAAWRLNERL